ncbi:MAG: argininosuccinate lyase [Bacteroidetes bacterium 4572_117]|nr:MAG: argininosuccinate lyase [Bacteroidetes bacterium 4572_117]
MKLWDKGTEVNKQIEQFTVGKDRELDMFLAEYDIIGSIAHCIMLESIGLLTNKELADIKKELQNIYQLNKNGKLSIDEGIEDIHSQIELLLTQKLGDAGKKIHNGRSRNDQVLLDLKLFVRSEIKEIVESMQQLFNSFITQSEKYKNILMPGYTHLQVAMPSSFGLWFGAYAESLTDDLQLLLSAYKIANQNPLGSAAGYGSSFPLDRQLTTDLLGFDRMNYNVVYAQMGRGKLERVVAFALSSIAATISKFSMDVNLFMSQNMGFISLPDELTTGSSIMPHKKNPDVFELLRAKCNKIQALPNEIMLITNNLPLGYFRDLQIIKENFIPVFNEMKENMEILNFMLSKIKVKENIVENKKYEYLFSVEEVNKRVVAGMPFRDAYKKVGLDIEKGEFNPKKTVNHTHEGSIGNLCNDKITDKMSSIIKEFNFEYIENAVNELLKC